MSRKIVLSFSLLLLFTINFPSRAGAMPTNTLTILPQDCRILAGEELPLTLDGSLPPDAAIRWDVDDGGVTSMLPGLNAIFIAPSEPEVVTISVSISSAVPGVQTLITQQCIVTSPNSAPKGLAQVPEIDGISPG